MYIKPQYRIGPFIIGLLLGHCLANFQACPYKVRRTLRFQVLGWFSAFVASFWAIFGLYPSLQVNIKLFQLDEY